MPAAEISFQLVDGRQAAALAADVQALHAEVCAGQDQAGFARRFATQCRQPGFVLAQARSGGYLVGCAAGMPLRPSTSWWRHLTTSLPQDVTTEHAGRTFAVTELGVRASWRRQRIGSYLHELLLSGRGEERATVVLPPAATAAQTAFQRWGWRRIARTQDPEPGSQAADVLVLALPVRS